MGKRPLVPGALPTICLATILITTASAQAGYVTYIALNAGSVLWYDADAQQLNYPWASASGMMQDADGHTYTLMSASISWTGNDLIQDLSQGGRAEGEFAAGGLVTLSGTILDPYFIPIFTGTILEAQVTDDFVMLETNNDNTVNTAALVSLAVIGGELATGTQTGLVMLDPQMGGHYVESRAQPGGGDVTDFQSDLSCTAGHQLQFFAVPEPASGLLILLAGGWVVRRRRGA